MKLLKISVLGILTFNSISNSVHAMQITGEFTRQIEDL